MTSMHAYIYQCDCRIRGKWKNPVCSYHRSSRKAAASRMWKKYEISLWKKSMEFPIQSHYLADISMKKLCHQSIAYITMEWR